MIVRELISLVGFKVDKAAMNRASNAARKLGSKMQSVGRTMSMALTLPITALGVGILKTAGDFEASMNRVMVLTNATAEDFEMLRNQARELGATTAFSAKEAADAMGFLAQAGFNTNEIFQAMPATLNLAAAAKQDLATTADQLSNIMQAFGLKASDAGHASDVLALAASSSNTNVSQLAEAMKYAAPNAKSLGVSMEETAAIMGFMGNAGVQASMAGTGLRMALMRLLDPAEEAQKAFDDLHVSTHTYGIDGKKSIRNIVDILQDLQDAKATPSQLNEIFGIRAFTGVTTVIDQSIDSLKEFVNTLENNSTGTAQRQQEMQMRGLNGAVLALKSAYGELAIAIGDAGLLDDTTKFTQKITNLVRELAKSNPETLKLATNIALFTAAVPLAIIALGSLTSAIGVMMANPAVISFAAMVAGLVGLGVLAHTLANPTKGAAAGIEPSGITAADVKRNPTGFFAPNGGTAAIVQAMSHPGFMLNKQPVITANSEVTVNLNGNTGLTQGEAFDAVRRAVDAAISDSLGKAQRDFAGGK